MAAAGSTSAQNLPLEDVDQLILDFALVREAIDQARPEDADRKRAAAHAILAVEPIVLPDDPADLKAEVRGARAGA